MSMLAPATIAEGILGLEAEHAWYVDLSATTLLARLNRNTGFPRYRLKSINGLHSLPDADDFREDVTGGIGERHFPSRPRGKTIVYNGFVEALTLPSLRAAVAGLRAAFSDRSSEHVMLVTPPEARGGVGWAYYARTLSCDVDDTQARGISAVFPHAREFSISLRQGEPRYGSFPGVTVDGAAGATFTVTNLGNAPAEPGFLLDAPTTPPKIERLGGPQPAKLEFVPSIAWAALAGKHLLIEFGRMPNITSPEIGGDFATLLTFDSNWFDDGVAGILPGAQSIKCTGCPIHVVFAHTSW